MIRKLQASAPFFLAGLLAGLCVSAPSSLSADDRVDRLPEAHRKWLEEEVVYIIAERERDVFLSLETTEERDRFIEAFWRKRDPNPATPENEYKVEHYRRIAHANEYLGRDTFRPGWRTDRGRYYILLGEPRETQRYEGYSELVSIELWFYQGDTMLGLPSFFYLLFFKQNDIGEYRLYSPIIDGPQALLTGSQYLPGTDNAPAVEALNQISPELAHASLSFDTGEPPDLVGGRPSLGTDIMIARIAESPKRAVRTDYADAWLRYGNLVSADYSFNYVPSRAAFALLREPGGTAILQYSIEIDPQNFSFETDEDKTKYYTTLDVSVEVRTADAQLVVANEKEVYLELTPSQIEQVKAYPFAFQDGLPVVAGDYTVTVVLRNRVVQQYTVAEREISIPEVTPGEPFLGDVILAFDTRLVAAADVTDDEVRTFQFGPTRIQPSADNLFVIGDTVHLVAQTLGVAAGSRLRFEVSSTDTGPGGGDSIAPIDAVVDANGLVVDQIRLDGIAGGNYQVAARLLAADGSVLSEKVVPMTVSPRSVATRPGFVYRRGFNTGVPGLLDLVRGEQLWNLERYDEAMRSLEKSVAVGNPRLPNARWKLAQAYLRQERADDALALLSPLEQAFSGQYEVVSGLGFAYYIKEDFARAADYLDRARQIRPPEVILLNALGDSQMKLGQAAKAKESFERSLQIDPNQPRVRELLDSLTASGGA